MKRFLFTCSIVIATMNIQAQTKDSKWNVGLVAGVTQYKGNLGNDFYTGNSRVYPVGGLSVTRFITSYIDVSLFAGRGNTGLNNSSVYYSNVFSTVLLDMRVHILGPNSIIRPYALIGAGTMFYDKGNRVKADRINTIAPSYGGGININMGSSVVINLQEAFHHTSKDKIYQEIPNEKATFLFHTVGVSFNLKNRKSK